MKIFEYAVILHPTEDEKKAGQQSQLLVDVKRVLARDQAAAFILASRDIPEEHLEKLDRMEVAVRPF
jgi:hypothetical protein